MKQKNDTTPYTYKVILSKWLESTDTKSSIIITSPVLSEIFPSPSGRVILFSDQLIFPAGMFVNDVFLHIIYPPLS